MSALAAVACSTPWHAVKPTSCSASDPCCCLQGNIIASADAEGVIKTWDVRKMAELRTLQATPNSKPVNSVAFDASGCVLAATTETGKVRLMRSSGMQVTEQPAARQICLHAPPESVSAR